MSNLKVEALNSIRLHWGPLLLVKNRNLRPLLHHLFMAGMLHFNSALLFCTSKYAMGDHHCSASELELLEVAELELTPV